MRGQLSEEVAAHLRDGIMSGRLRPGDFVRLEEVAAELEVSITPVREALLTLRGEDMVELVPRRGYVVAPLSRQDVADLFALQAHVAGELAARAARHVTPADLAELREVQAALAEAIAEQRPEEVAHLEFVFHRQVNRLADARKLSWFLHTATRYTPARFYATDAAWLSGTADDHERLLTALGGQDPEASREAMARHFTGTAERLVEHLAGVGLWTPAALEA